MKQRVILFCSMVVACGFSVLLVYIASLERTVARQREQIAAMHQTLDAVRQQNDERAAAVPQVEKATPAKLRLRATHMTLLADGKQSTDIIADLCDGSGKPFGANIIVQFSATVGQLSSAQAVTNASGEARVRLTSDPIVGTCHVSTFTPGATVDTIDIAFTDVPVAPSVVQNSMAFQAKDFLAYSANDRIIQADEKEGAAGMTFRNIRITADRLQFRCNDNILRAQGNIIFKRGADVVKVSHLYYNLPLSQGYAYGFDEHGKGQFYKILGEHLRCEKCTLPIFSSYLRVPDLSYKRMVVARSITYFPGDRLQFRHPKFFQDNTQIMALPYYELPLKSKEFFSDSFFSGTNSLSFEPPRYDPMVNTEANWENFTTSRFGEKLVPPSDPVYKDADFLRRRHLLEGCPTGNFSGQRLLTRYEFALNLDRVLRGLKTSLLEMPEAFPTPVYGLVEGSGNVGGVNQEELGAIKRLYTEFRSEMEDLGDNSETCDLFLQHLQDIADRASQISLKDLPDLNPSGSGFFGRSRGEVYKVDPYIRAAMTLQSMGKVKACETLLTLASYRRRNHDDMPLFLLCRMLFVAREGGEFRRPSIGYPILPRGSSLADWPLEPIEIVDGVPFLITHHYGSFSGRPETASLYVQYCIQHCDWNKTPFQMKSMAEKQQALEKLLTSPKGQRFLGDYEKNVLSDQILDTKTP